MSKKNLLIVDDDKTLCELFELGLSSSFNVSSTDDADIAYRIATKNPPDVILLDVQLKKESGIDLCQKLRQNPLTTKIPIFMITGLGTTENMLKSYSAGSDDFIEKPIDIDHLSNRLTSRLKRIEELSQFGSSYGNLKIYPERSEIELDGHTHKLSEIEFDLLRIFLTNPNKKISRDDILKAVWNDIKVTERTVDVHVSSLRKKLKNFNHTIKSMYGSGYILKPLQQGVSDE